MPHNLLCRFASSVRLTVDELLGVLCQRLSMLRVFSIEDTQAIEFVERDLRLHTLLARHNEEERLTGAAMPEMDVNQQARQLG